MSHVLLVTSFGLCVRYCAFIHIWRKYITSKNTHIQTNKQAFVGELAEILLLVSVFVCILIAALYLIHSPFIHINYYAVTKKKTNKYNKTYVFVRRNAIKGDRPDRHYHCHDHIMHILIWHRYPCN